MPSVASAVKVLVTGFGDFTYISPNPSFEIIKSLPSSLPATDLFPSGIELVLHQSAVPVAYHPTFSLVPELYTSPDFASVDFVLHVGVADGRDYFAVEQSSAQSVGEIYGYHTTADVDGEYFTEEEQVDAWGEGAQGGPQEARLETDLDLTEIVALWQERTEGFEFPPVYNGSSSGFDAAEAPGAKLAGKGVSVKVMDDFTEYSSVAKRQEEEDDDVKWSDDAGFFLCGFIYYCGLVEMGKLRDSRDLTFMHVPYLQGEEQIALGVDVTTELIYSMAESWQAQQMRK